MNDLPSSATDLSKSLEILLASDISPQEFTRQLFQLNYTRAKASDPALGDMLRACAIPRTFNAQIIGVLRDARDDAATNERLLADLLAFSFVLPVQTSGDHTYHDNTRQMLWDEWKSTKNSVEFAQYKARLVIFYQAQGESAYEAEMYEEALAHFNRALELQPGNGQLYSWRGRTYVAVGAYQTAQVDLSQALSYQINDSATYFALAAAHYYLGDYLDCVIASTKIIEYDQTDPNAYNNRGAAYSKLKEYGKALVHLGINKPPLLRGP